MHDIDRTLLESEEEMYEDEFEDEEQEDELEDESPFSEEEENELASELLTISSEEELDQFLGKLFKKVGRFARKVIRSPIAGKLGGALKKVAKIALPIAGRTLGTVFGGPAGGAIGGKLGSFASRLFELELEGLSPEEQELECARRFVRLAGAAAQRASRFPRGAHPANVVNSAMQLAARRHAPGLLRMRGGFGAFPRSSRGGRWMRRGRHIVLINAA